jgi:uncharacterized protein (DUF2461 family)
MKNKQRDAVKENYSLFIGELQEKIKKVDTIVIEEPKKYISRINRDIRFTADKTLYRINIFSFIERNSSENIPKFYLQFQLRDNSFATCV